MTTSRATHTPPPFRRQQASPSWPLSLSTVVRSGVGEVKRLTAGAVLIGVDDGHAIEHFLLNEAEFQRWLEARSRRNPLGLDEQD